MQYLKGLGTLALGPLVSLMGGIASAETVTFGFRGTVTEVIDLAGLLQGKVQANNSFSGRFSFDSGAVDQDASSEWGSYSAVPPFVVNVGQLSWSSTGAAYIRIGNNPTNDQYAAYALPFTSGTLRIVELGITLNDPSAGVFGSDHLPLVPPPLESFSTRRFWLQGRSLDMPSEEFAVQGEVSLLPEPTTGFFLASGAFLFLRRRRRRSRVLLGLTPLFWGLPEDKGLCEDSTIRPFVSFA